MKKILSIAFCAAAVSAFAASTETILGQVGVTAITSSNQNTIVAVSYDDLAGGSGIVVSNFVKTANLTKGDQLAIFNNGTGTEIYDTWVLRENDNKVLYWAKNDKTFYVDANGQLQEGEGTPASIVTNSVGTGIWLCRKVKPTKPFTFYIYGKPVSDPESKIPAGTWTLVGNPLQNTKVTASTIQVDDAQTGDQIVTVGENGTLLYFAYVKNLGWSGLPDIGPGIGFWIKTLCCVRIMLRTKVFSRNS